MHVQEVVQGLALHHLEKLFRSCLLGHFFVCVHFVGLCHCLVSQGAYLECYKLGWEFLHDSNDSWFIAFKTDSLITLFQTHCSLIWALQLITDVINDCYVHFLFIPSSCRFYVLSTLANYSTSLKVLVQISWLDVNCKVSPASSTCIAVSRGGNDSLPWKLTQVFQSLFSSFNSSICHLNKANKKQKMHYTGFRWTRICYQDKPMFDFTCLISQCRSCSSHQIFHLTIVIRRSSRVVLWRCNTKWAMSVDRPTSPFLMMRYSLQLEDLQAASTIFLMQSPPTAFSCLSNCPLISIHLYVDPARLHSQDCGHKMQYSAKFDTGYDLPFKVMMMTATLHVQNLHGCN